MDAKKVTQRCDVLRNLVCVGPGDNPAILRKALGIVGSLDGAAKWDYPRQILGDLKERFLDLVIGRGEGMRRSCIAPCYGTSTSYRRPGRNQSVTR